MVMFTEKLSKQVEKAQKRNKAEAAKAARAKPKNGAGEGKAKGKAKPEATSSRIGAPAKVKNKADEAQVQQNTDDIVKLHKAIEVALSKSLETAYAIGELLFVQKELIEHGRFTRWVDDNLPLKIRTVQRYMKLFQYKRPLIKKGVESITDAYHYIFSEPVSDEVVNADDSTNIKSTMTVKQMVNIDKIKLPKQETKGKCGIIELTSSTVDDLVSGDGLSGEEGTYDKFVIEYHKNSKWNDSIGPLVIAAAIYLRPGGVIVFRKV